MASHRQDNGSSRRIDLNRRRHSGCQDNALGHVIDMDANRDPLRQPHPGEDWVDRGDPLSVWLCVGPVDRTGDAVDTAENGLRVAHKLDLGPVADMDWLDIEFLEIPIDPERISVDN